MREITEFSKIKNHKTFADIIESRINLESSSVSFEDLFGDLSNCSFQGCLNLTNLNLNSLKGCPKEVSGGFLSIEYNPNLESLDFFPQKLCGGVLGMDFYIDFHAIGEVEKISAIIKNLNTIICFNNKENFSEIDIALSFFDLRFVKGNYNFLSARNKELGDFEKKLDYDTLERIYDLYRKLDYDKEKLIRVLKLL